MACFSSSFFNYTAFQHFQCMSAVIGEPLSRLLCDFKFPESSWTCEKGPRPTEQLPSPHRARTEPAAPPARRRCIGSAVEAPRPPPVCSPGARRPLRGRRQAEALPPCETVPGTEAGAGPPGPAAAELNQQLRNWVRPTWMRCHFFLSPSRKPTLHASGQAVASAD